MGQQVTKKKMAATKLGVTGHEKKNKRPRLGVNIVVSGNYVVISFCSVGRKKVHPEWIGGQKCFKNVFVMLRAGRENASKMFL